jgi:hypothetical protein
MNSNTNIPVQSLSVVDCNAHPDTEFKRRQAPLIGKRVVLALSAALLAACGGGGSTASSSESTVSLATVTTGYTTKPTTPTTFVPTPTTVAPALTAGVVLTDVKIQNTGSAQGNVPFTFGQVFAAGELSTSEGLVAKLADGTLVRLQTDVKATHADGSVRHAIISGVLPSLAAGASPTIQLAKSTLSEKSTVTPQSMLDAGLSSDVTITINNTNYSASLANAVAAGTPINWLSGTTANEWIFNAPLKDAAGNVHPMLTARFDVRWYSGLTRQARVEVVVENSKTFVAGSNLTYDVNVNVAGRSVYAKTGLTHYHHSRWHQSAWWDAATAPALNVQLNTAYLIASKAVSNYDQSVIPAESALADLGKQINSTNTGPMTIGPVVPYMGMTGARPDIAPLPNWSVLYLLSGDKRARDAMMAAADGSGSWSIHYRDEKTGYPVRTDNDINKNISLHVNAAHLGPLPVPRCAPSDTTSCTSPYTHDTAHEPSLAFLPYLVTGDYYYLEEMQFWAATNPLETGPGYNGFGQGLVRWQQVRGQAWSLRTLGHVAYITPDVDPMKAYFTKQLDNNLNFYHQTYVVGNPNKLGAYDGSGEAAFQIEGSAPWQDDFLTWSFAYLSELGFSKATPILQWKSKYVVSRMTAPDFCWIQAASYFLLFRDSPTSPVYDTMGQVFAKTFSTDLRNEDNMSVTAPAGQSLLTLKCGSQEQADLLAVLNQRAWPVGRMTGYAESATGYPANMQPALAVASTSGIENGTKAWAVYMGRVDKPDFSKQPQFDIIPR